MIELTNEVKQQVIGLVRDYLTDRFSEDDPIVFEPIVIDLRYGPGRRAVPPYLRRL